MQSLCTGVTAVTAVAPAVTPAVTPAGTPEITQPVTAAEIDFFDRFFRRFDRFIPKGLLVWRRDDLRSAAGAGRSGSGASTAPI